MGWIGAFRVAAGGVGTVYVANAGDSSITVLDGTNHIAIDRVRVGSGPSAVAFSVDGRNVWVANQESGQLTVIDRGTQTVARGVSIGGSPNALLFGPDGRVLYATDTANDTLLVIDPDKATVTERISVGDRPVAIALSPDAAHVAVANNGADSVTIVDGKSLVPTAEIRVGKGPMGLVFGKDNNTLFVTVSEGVAVVDLQHEQTTHVWGPCAGARQTIVTHDFRHLYVVCSSTNHVAIFDATTGQLLKQIEVGHGPTGITLSEDPRWVFVTNTADHTVSVLNTTRHEVESVAVVGQNPIGIIAGAPSDTAIQFKADVPTVMELQRRGIAPIAGSTSNLGAKIVAAVTLGFTPVGFGIELLRRRRNRRL